MESLVSLREPARGFSAWLADSPPARAQVAAFVNPIYVKTYECPPPPADAYSAINFDGELVCCMGLEWAGPDGCLGIERAYHLDRSRLPLAISGAVQLGRWVSKVPGAGKFAIYAAALSGLARGSQVALIEHDDRVHRHCRKLGVKFHELPHDGVDLSAIDEAARQHYSKGTMTPYLVELAQVRSVLEAGCRGLIVEPALSNQVLHGG
jgi:hypothetical protein